MRKYMKLLIILSFISITFINVRVYAADGFSEVLDVLHQIPYLRDIIEQFFVYNNSFSLIMFRLVKSFMEFIFGVIIVTLFKNFVTQGSIILLMQSSKVLLSGVLAYILLIMILVIFFASFIGFPVGAIIFIVSYITIISGKVALQVYIGHFVELKFKRSWHIYLDYLVGTLLIEAVITAPYIGNVFSYFIVPVISIGLFIVTIANKFIYKKYYTVNLSQTLLQNNFSKQQNIRKIVMQGIDK